MTRFRKHRPMLGLALLGCGALLACGGRKGAEAPTIEKQSAADEILRISNVWASVLPTKGILSAPSPISVFKRTERSQLHFFDDTATELLVFEEVIELRAGNTVHCVTKFEHAVQARFGRRQGEPAVELTRPALSAPRDCDAPHPEGVLQEEARRGLFVLRSDQLIAVEPPLEKRAYLPRAL